MTLDDLKKMSLNDMREAANKLTDEELGMLEQLTYLDEDVARAVGLPPLDYFTFVCYTNLIE